MGFFMYKLKINDQTSKIKKRSTMSFQIKQLTHSVDTLRPTVEI